MSLLAGKKILVVDDEEMILEIFKDELELHGAKVDKAGNGHVALQKFKNITYDLVLSDFRMPVCDGLTMAKEIRKTHRPLPKIILCTAFAKDLTPQARLEGGVFDVIEKPFDLTNVVEVLERCFASQS